MKSLGKIWPLLIILPFILSPTPHIAFQTQFLSMSSLQPLQKMINQDSFSQWWQTTGNAAHDNEDSSEQRLEIQDYRIQKGDSIDKIAAKFQVDRNTLFALNPKQLGSLIIAGKYMLVSNVEGQLYNVKGGETPRSIVKMLSKHDINLEKFCNLNDLDPNDRLIKGQRVFVPDWKLSDDELIERLFGKQFSGPLSCARKSSGFSKHRVVKYKGKVISNGPHRGLDLAAPRGKAVRAMYSGRVTFAGWQGGYGKLIIVRSKDGRQVKYGHLSKIRVKKGQYVKADKVIGNVGSTGRSTGPHLHLEILIKGVAKDPLKVEPKLKKLYSSWTRC